MFKYYEDAFIFIFSVCWYFARMYICVLYACLVHIEAVRGFWIPRTGVRGNY